MNVSSFLSVIFFVSLYYVHSLEELIVLGLRTSRGFTNKVVRNRYFIKGLSTILLTLKIRACNYF